jgi:hypothetical protein
MVKGKSNFNRGDLVILRIANKTITRDGFGTVGLHSDDRRAVLYEYIQTESYPSCNDFQGRSGIVKDGTKGIVIKKVGRPGRIITSEAWEQYDIYEVLFDCYAYQVFAYNLEFA